MTKKKLLPLSKLFPNIITLMGLCFGLTSIKYTFIEKWELAVTFIVIAAIIDGMDGRIARLLNATSEFGAQLDSLADFLNFGVAPAFLLYFWALQEIKVYGWMLVMLLVICMSIRLARFNTTMHEEVDNEDEKFFHGIPAPMGALLALTPLILSFNDNIFLHYRHLIMDHIFIFLLIVTILVVSRVPTFSPKSISIPNDCTSLFMLLFGILMVFITTKTWVTLAMINFIYVLSIPVTIIISILMRYKLLFIK